MAAFPHVSLLSTSTTSTTTTNSLSSPNPPKALQRSPKMSITQTFYLAHKARGKLSNEAARQDHKLRLLVGHANLLDTLMIHLAEAEQDQEAWYNGVVRTNEEERSSSREWSEKEEEDEDEEDEEYGSLPADYDSDSESSDDEEDEDEMEETEAIRYAVPVSVQSFRQTEIEVQEVAEDYDEEAYDTEEDMEEDDFSDEDGMFTLKRTTSHRPPSLCSDLSDSEDEDSNPPSPPQPTIMPPQLSRKDRIHAATTSYYDSHHESLPDDPRDSLFDSHYLMPPTPAIGAY